MLVRTRRVISAGSEFDNEVLALGSMWDEGGPVSNFWRHPGHVALAFYSLPDQGCWERVLGSVFFAAPFNWQLSLIE